MSKVIEMSKEQKKTHSGNENPMKANAVTPITKPKNKLPLGYKLEADGIYWLDPNQDEPSPMWLCSPLEIVGLTCDDAGTNWGRVLAFCDAANNCKKWVMPMELLTGGKSDLVFQQLGKLGATVSTAYKARTKLAELLNRAANLPILTCVNRIGWYEDAFILPMKTFTAGKTDVVYQVDKLDDLGFTQRGTLKEWQEKIARFAVDNSRLMLAMSAAFAAPLLTPLDIEGGGFHFRGRSSQGKTIALYVAGSVWGSHERKKMWRATDNGLELTAFQHNDSVLLLDEIGEMDGKTIGKAVYMLANGQGKNRANELTVKRWRLLVLSTGEIDIQAAMMEAGITAKAGQEVRLVNIEARAGEYGIFDQLDSSFNNSQEQAEYLRRKTNKYYGMAGIAYLEAITKNKNQALAFVNQAMAEFIQAVELPKNTDSQIKRVLNRFAVVAAGGELATHYDITGWKQGDATQCIKKCFQDWLDSKGNIEHSHEHREAIERVRGIIERHGSTRFEDYTQRTEAIYQSEPSPSRDRLGIKFTKDGKTVYLFYPTQFKNEVCKGLNVKTVIASLRADGLLEAAKGRAQLQSPTMKDGSRFWGYGVKAEILENSQS